MQDLHVVGTDSDGRLLLAAAPGGRPRFRLDAGAATGALGGAEPAGDGADTRALTVRRRVVPRRTLSPAELQARLRTGISAAELAAETGHDPAWVERLARPVRAEMEGVLRAALASPVTDGATTSDGDLRSLLVAGLPDGASLEQDVAWDPVRRRDGSWRLTLRATLGARVVTATWVWSPRERRLVAASARARAISFPGVGGGG